MEGHASASTWPFVRLLADFDGDEMNLHVIQSEEARAEAKILMRVRTHPNSRYGGAVIGGIHDHITGAYLLSRPGTAVRQHTVSDAWKHATATFPNS